jgi:hypothetical protein
MKLISYGVPEKGGREVVNTRASFMGHRGAAGLSAIARRHGLGRSDGLQDREAAAVNVAMLDGQLRMAPDDGGLTDGPPQLDKYFIRAADRWLKTPRAAVKTGRSDRFLVLMGLFF